MEPWCCKEPRRSFHLSEKRALADFVVDNSDGLEQTRRLTREVYEKLVASDSSDGARAQER